MRPATQSRGSTRRTRFLLCLGGLALLLGGQVFFLLGAIAPQPLTGPTIGQPLPNAVLVRESGEPVETLGRFLSRSKARCILVVAVDPDCGVCRRLKAAWNDRFEAWLDSAGRDVEAVWLADADSVSLAEFYQGVAFRDTRLARVVGSTEVYERSLWIYATPTMYLLDDGKKLAIGSLGDFPPAEAARSVCAPAGTIEN